MPPASLSTLAVMNPGPMTASTRAIRVFQCFHENVTGTSGSRLAAMSEHGDHVVGGDDAGKAFVLVHHGERHEVVFVEQGRDFIVRRVRRAADWRLAQLNERG